MRLGMVGGSYTARSSAIADEEAINWYQEAVESQGAIVPTKAYGGSSAGGVKAMVWAPGTAIFSHPGGVPRGGIEADGRCFFVCGNAFYEFDSAGNATNRGAVVNDGNPASLAFNGIQILIVSAGQIYCFTLSNNTFQEVSASLAGIPVAVDEIDTYFVLTFANSNKFQFSNVLDGTNWPGVNVNIPSTFPENIIGLKVNHDELWIFGTRHTQVYQNTGSASVFDPIKGSGLLEKGLAGTFASALLDNSIFWVDEDARGGRSCWRSNGYTPTRVSTHAVETDLATYKQAQIQAMTTWSYQDGGHLFWVLYIPGSPWSWCYDIAEGTWHKRAQGTGTFKAHYGWNHVYCFGKHLIGDWGSSNILDLNISYLTDAGSPIRRLRRAPTVTDEMKWIPHAELTLDFDTGQGPQPPLTDGNGNPRAPQCMVRWSDDRGKTWSNEHLVDCGQAGNYTTRAIIRRLGRSRYRVYEVSVIDPIKWVLVDGYLRVA